MTQISTFWAPKKVVATIRPSKSECHDSKLSATRFCPVSRPCAIPPEPPLHGTNHYHCRFQIRIKVSDVRGQYSWWPKKIGLKSDYKPWNCRHDISKKLKTGGSSTQWARLPVPRNMLPSEDIALLLSIPVSNRYLVPILEDLNPKKVTCFSSPKFARTLNWRLEEWWEIEGRSA
jgi:hypothetical protein